MEDAVLSSPFGVEPLPEVHLADAPLARTLAQVRFPQLSALAAPSTEVPMVLAGKLADQYPLFSTERGMGFLTTPEGLVATPDFGRVWRMCSPDGAWQVSLGDNFVSLDTSSYPGRDAFFTRLRDVLALLFEATQVVQCERIGVRYINRIVDQPVLDRLPALVRPEVLGGLGIPDSTDKLVHSITETLFAVGADDHLMTRWGVLPSNAVIDPSIPLVAGKSWILDLDAFSTQPTSPDAGAVSDVAHRLAERSYRFFRWAVTDEFLIQHGGEA